MDKRKDKNKILNKIFVAIFIIIGILVRTVGISDVPQGLNCDEASSAYEAYSILNYGIDRNGNLLPVFLESWGSGQNALYTYLIIPFIKIIGLNILATRLPMAIIGCISLIIMYLLLKEISNNKMACIGLTFFAICPWHIMKSRWGLESNIFPDLMLLSIYLMVTGLSKNKKAMYYLSFVIAGLCAYAYGTSYFFLPVFLIPLLILLVKKGEITKKEAIISLIITTVISLPIILFVIINTFKLEQINLPFLTIPRLEVNRYETITSIFSKDFIMLTLKNISSALLILFLQNDGLIYNAIWPFGTIYIFSTVFTIIGIIKSFKKNSDVKYNYIFNVWIIASVLMLAVVNPNINRINIIMIPIIYYTILGIYSVLKDNSIYLYILFFVIYIFSFTMFLYSYKSQSDMFQNNLGDAINYMDNLKNDNIYMSYSDIQEPYIYVLYYTKFNTKEFYNTATYYDGNLEFRKVKNFANYNFTIRNNIDFNQKNNVYLLKKSNYDVINKENNLNVKVTEFGEYVVLEIL